MGNLFSRATPNNRKIQTKLSKSYVKPKPARYLISKAPLFSNLFGADQQHNIFSKYKVFNEDLDENNFAQTFIHKILNQENTNSEKIQELESLNSKIEGSVIFKEIKKENSTWSAYIIIKNNLKRYKQEINDVIEKLKLQNTKNKRANNGSAAKSNDLGSKLPVENEETSTRRSNLNYPAKSVGNNLPNESAGKSAANSKMNNPANLTSESKPQSNANPAAVEAANSENKLKANLKANSLKKYNNKLSVEKTKELHYNIETNLDNLKRRMENYISNQRKKNREQAEELKQEGIYTPLKKLNQYKSDDCKNLEKLKQIYQLLSGKKFNFFGGKNLSEYIFEGNEREESMTKFINEINEELKGKNKETLKQEFNSIIKSLYKSYFDPNKEIPTFPIYESNKNETISGGSRKKSKKSRS